MAAGLLARASAEDRQAQASGAPNRGHGFVRDGRGFTTTDAPRASLTAVYGGNSRRQIVGGYLDGRQRFHGFLKDRRGFRRIDFPGAPGAWASRIDERGRIVGSYSERRAAPAGQFEHGFLLKGGAASRDWTCPGHRTRGRPASTRSSRSWASTSIVPAPCTASCASGTARWRPSTLPAPPQPRRTTSTTTAGSSAGVRCGA
jgi:hypothetical protein